MNAYPKTDVGLHNALKYVFNLDKKPTMEYIEEVFSHFQDWEAYLCFYLWRTLY
jgi:DNA-3-methyladenine glycosylase II